MPTISRFYGILIQMFFNEHNPPHFHAKYNDHEAIVDIQTLQVTTNKFPKTALKLVLEWAEKHQTELMKNWELAKQHKDLFNIDPLD